jgi:hypothetical protein
MTPLTFPQQAKMPADLDSLSPREAMNLLYELKQQVD